MTSIVHFHNWLLVIITVITLFVLGLLVTVVVKFNARACQSDAVADHLLRFLAEPAWTLIPVAILLGIAISSFKLSFFQSYLPKADLTIKATGKQWYWTCTYPDNGKFDSIRLLAGDEARTKCNAPRLLSVDESRAGQQGGPRPDHRRLRDPLLPRCRPSASRST